MNRAITHWWNSLRPGDRVRVRFIWNDSKTPGGEIRRGRVMKDRLGRDTDVRHGIKGHTIRFTNPRGSRIEEFRRSPFDNYVQIIPIDRDFVYDEIRGYVMGPKETKK